MCFSSTASFISAATLIAAGTTGIFLTKNKAYQRLSTVPIIFGLQQAAEGFLWKALKHPEFSQYIQPLTIAFLFIAWIVWPMYIPWVFRKIDSPKKNNLVFNILFSFGIMVSLFYTYTLIAFIPRAEIQENHIAYHWNEYRNYVNIFNILYVISVLLPPFYTRNKSLWILGSVHIIMFIFSYVFLVHYLISVWCFLSAVSSIIILFVVLENNKSKSFKLPNI